MHLITPLKAQKYNQNNKDQGIRHQTIKPLKTQTQTHKATNPIKHIIKPSQTHITLSHTKQTAKTYAQKSHKHLEQLIHNTHNHISI